MDIQVLDVTEELLTKFKIFLKDYTIDDNSNLLTEFGQWLQESNTENMEYNHENTMIDVLIGMQLITMSNVIKNRLNNFVNDSPFATFMDYQFLYVLMEHGEMTKSDIITANYMAMSSGIEVIKRLLKKDWILEQENPKDKRSKIVKIANAGKVLVNEHKSEADALYSSFCSGLGSSRKTLTFNTLQKIVEMNT